MLKTAVIGASGYIGRHLLATYKTVYPEILGTTFSTKNPDLIFFDLKKPNISLLKLEELGYQSVIIASVDNPLHITNKSRLIEAYERNVLGTIELIRQLGRTSLQTIFFSTDYVFDGVLGNYTDSSPTLPTTEYGKHKVLVEKEIPLLTNNFMVIRLCKIYGLVKGDSTLLDEIAFKLFTGQVVQAAADQFFSPTLIDDLVAAILRLQSDQKTGYFNLCSHEVWSRYQIATLIAKAIGSDLELVKAIKLHELTCMAGRPLNTSMKCSNEINYNFTPLAHSIEIMSQFYQ